MSDKTPTPAPGTPETPELSPEAAALAKAFTLLKTDPEAFKVAYPELAAYAPPIRPKTIRDYQREVDEAIVGYVPALVASNVPEEHRARVAQLVANQLHHLINPASGLWPTDLPKPDRSEWR
jgi:hypothetical protein